MIDTSPEGLAALLRESNHLVPWTDPEPPAELEPEPGKGFSGGFPDEFGAWMLSLPLHPWRGE